MDDSTNDVEVIEDLEEEFSKTLIYRQQSDSISVRNNLLMESLKKFDEKDEIACIYYQTKALAKGIEQNYNFPQHHVKINLKNEAENIINAIKMNQTNIKKNSTKIENYNEIIKKCAQFPDEWTIIQLCREFHPHSIFLRSHKIFTQNSPIYISLLKYPHWAYNSKKPICLKIDPINDINVYERCYNMRKLLSELYDKLIRTKNPTEQLFYQNEIVDETNKIILLLKKFIDPWICLFRGKSKTDSQIDAEQKLFIDVKKYLANGFQNREIILIFLYARNIDLMDSESLKKFCLQLNIRDKKKEKLITFLDSLQCSNYTIKDETHEYYPTLMIIDELLDHFPWEFILPTQEFTRLFSFYILEKLHNEYKNEIVNGYLTRKIRNGGCLINNDSTLIKMEKRLTQFYEQWLPNFKIIKSENKDDAIDVLSNSDIYIYCGHGSGLQCMRANKLLEFSINCPAFLFGCNSVSLTPNGFNNEMMGAHVFYHLSKCPTVLGYNFIVTDTECDLVSTKIISKFIPLKKPFNWNAIDKKKFRDGEIDFTQKKKVETETDSNLQQIVASIRCDSTIAIKMRISVLIRGLPLCNNF